MVKAIFAALMQNILITAADNKYNKISCRRNKMNTPDFRNYKNAEIDKTIDAAMTSLRTITGNSMDLNIMNVKICSVSCALVSIEGMISTSAMSELIFRPIMELSARKSKGNAEQVFDFLTKESLLAAERKTVFNYGDVIQFCFRALRSYLWRGFQRLLFTVSRVTTSGRFLSLQASRL